MVLCSGVVSVIRYCRMEVFFVIIVVIDNAAVSYGSFTGRSCPDVCESVYAVFSSHMTTLCVIDGAVCVFLLKSRYNTLLTFHNDSIVISLPRSRRFICTRYGDCLPQHLGFRSDVCFTLTTSAHTVHICDFLRQCQNEKGGESVTIMDSRTSVSQGVRVTPPSAKRTCLQAVRACSHVQEQKWTQTQDF